LEHPCLGVDVTDPDDNSFNHGSERWCGDRHIKLDCKEKNNWKIEEMEEKNCELEKEPKPAKKN